MNARLLSRRARARRRPDFSVARSTGSSRAVSRMNRLIADLLDIARVEAGRLSIASRAAVRRQAWWPTRSRPTGCRLLRRPARFTRSSRPDLLDLWADRDRLLQVFENLIGNALKFTEPGGSVTVGAAPRDGEVLFWGDGIPGVACPRRFPAPARSVLAGSNARSAARDWGCPSSKASSRPMAGGSGSRARPAAAPPSSSPFPRRVAPKPDPPRRCTERRRRASGSQTCIFNRGRRHQRSQQSAALDGLGQVLGEPGLSARCTVGLLSIARQGDQAGRVRQLRRSRPASS